MDVPLRYISRGAVAIAAGAALVVSTATPALAQDDVAYPDPSVSVEVDGGNIITTVTDNGEGEIDGAEVGCFNLGMYAIEALPLATQDLADIELFDVIELAEWIELQPATVDTPDGTVVVDANEVREEMMGFGPLEPGAYASIGACLWVGTETEPGGIVSMDYVAPIFVPGGIGSVGQALDLGSGVLSAEGGSSTLLDLGSATILDMGSTMLGS